MKKLCFLLILILPFFAKAQQIRCSTEKAEEFRRLQNHSVESKANFEKWISKKISKTKNKLSQGKTTEATYIIPVVVHIIHNGEAVGKGSNISDDLINAQIQVLNEDYERLNADSASTRSIFKPVAANCNIQFQLALSDPDGFPTTGIVRAKGSKTTWDITDNDKLKATSYWNSSQYLNIWVCKLTSRLLGYAQYPESNLPGLTSSDLDISAFNQARNAKTDGVVISYNAFGRFVSTTNAFNKGRTTTHEVGHYLGLRHIWGDTDDCTGSDYCDDTPKVKTETYQCDLNKKACDPNVFAMVENYMDYSDDACMNIFSNDQKLRMRTVLESCPRRLSLLSSKGLFPPSPSPDNAGIKNIISPSLEKYCQPQIDFKVVLKNYGNNNLTSSKISYQIDNLPSTIYNWTGNLIPAQSDTILLESISSAIGQHLFRVNTDLPNGNPDTKTYNDTLVSSYWILKASNLPFKENFNGSLFPPAGWSVYNPDLQITWKNSIAGGSFDVNNKAAFINLYDYKERGQSDYLYSPSYDFSKVSIATLLFNVGYAQDIVPDDFYDDGFKILVSTDCGNNYNDIIYEKYSADLASTKDTNSWAPKHFSDWKNESIDLSSYLGSPSVSFAFVSVNDYGNNIFLDDIQVQLVTGSESSSKEEEIIIISPNPNDGNFSIDLNLKSPDDINIQVTDALGKMIWHTDIKEVIRVNIPAKLNNVSAGMYFVNINGKNFKKVKKIIIY